MLKSSIKEQPHRAQPAVARALSVTLAAYDATPFVEVHVRAYAGKLGRQLLTTGATP